MRGYLNDIEIVGATMCYREGEICHWSLDWLYANCDRVCVLLDNWDEETEKIVLGYKEKYPDRTHVIYSGEPVRARTNVVAGQMKRRFKLTQNNIREYVLRELERMHGEKPIDMLIFMDSDETYINEFPRHLEAFWKSTEQYMMLGFLEPLENFQTIMNQIMAPHGRVYKYVPEMTANPYRIRTIYHPFYGRAYKVRNVVLHMCHFTEEYRVKRQFCDNRNFLQECERCVWILPKDVREMTVEEIADYQFGQHRSASKFPPITYDEFLKINNK